MNNKLERKYGLFTAICMVVGIVIGSGVFFKAQTILQITNGDMPLGVIAWLIGGAIMLACIPLYRRVQEKLDRVLGATRENLDGVRVIRAFRLQNRETDAFSEKNADLTHMQRFVGRISALLNPLTYVIVNLAIVAILRTGAVRVDSGALTQGQVIALYNYMSQILVELIKFANLILNITRSVASGSRIGQLLEQEPSLSAPDAMPQPVDTDEAVSFHHVTFRCPGAEVPTLSDIDFTAKRGQTIGIIGGTGSGKTMLANLIGRFYDVDEGSVTVNGVDVRDYPLAALRAKLGLVPQKALLFRGTIRENLLWGDANATDEEIVEACKAASAHDFITSFPTSHPIPHISTSLTHGQQTTTPHHQHTTPISFIRTPLLPPPALTLHLYTPIHSYHPLPSTPPSSQSPIPSTRSSPRCPSP